MSSTLKIFADSDELATHAARFVITTIADAIRERGRAMIALSGGTTWPKTYALLAQPEMRDQIDWSRAYVFFGDERFVPVDDPENNFGMARRVLLEPVCVPRDNIFPIPTHVASPAAAAEAYVETISTTFGSRGDGTPPRFDLMLLGLGSDGHVAALFPGAASLSVEDRWVVASPPGVLQPHVDRITMTFPVMNAARVGLFLVSGAGKASVLRDVLEGGCSREECPAVAVAPESGELYWFVDQAAATRLSPKR